MKKERLTVTKTKTCLFNVTTLCTDHLFTVLIATNHSEMMT